MTRRAVRMGCSGEGPPGGGCQEEQGLPGTQLVTRMEDDSGRANLLAAFNLNAIQGQHDIARLDGSSGGCTDAFTHRHA